MSAELTARIDSPHVNHTASSAARNPIDGIIENLDKLSQQKSTAGLKPFLGPIEKVLRDLHLYAVDAEKSDDKQSIIEASEEIGSKLADSWRTMYEGSRKKYNGFMKMLDGCISTVCEFWQTKKAKAKVDDSLDEQEVISLIRFSEDRNGALIAHSEESLPAITFRYKSTSTPEDVEVKSPLKLFEYIRLGYQRNKLMGDELGENIRSWVILGRCIKDHIEAGGNDYIVSRKDLKEKGYQGALNVLKFAEAWNKWLARDNKPSSLSDFGVQSLSDEEVSSRNAVLASRKTSRGRSVDPIENPNKLLEFIRLTKAMQAIRPFFNKTPRVGVEEAKTKNPNFRYHDIIMDWYMQLDQDDAIISPVDFARQKRNICEDSAFTMVRETKKRWNKKERELQANQSASA